MYILLCLSFLKFFIAYELCFRFLDLDKMILWLVSQITQTKDFVPFILSPGYQSNYKACAVLFLYSEIFYEIFQHFMQCTLSILSPQLLSSHPFPAVFKIAPFCFSFPKGVQCDLSSFSEDWGPPSRVDSVLEVTTLKDADSSPVNIK